MQITTVKWFQNRYWEDKPWKNNEKVNILTLEDSNDHCKACIYCNHQF